MDDETKTLIANLEAQIKELKVIFTKEIARLDAYNVEAFVGLDKYVENHSDQHAKLERMIYPAYYKTHPGVLATLLQADNILGQLKDDGSDPQP